MRKATWSYCTYSSLVKLQPRFLSLQWKTCLWAELQPWCLSVQSRTCPWAEHWWWFLYYIVITKPLLVLFETVFYVLNEVVTTNLKEKPQATARRGGIAGPGFDPRAHFLIARLYITGLDQIPNPSVVYTLRRHMVVLLLIAIRPSDWDGKPGGPLGAFGEEQAMRRHRVFSFSLHFIINPHNTITLYKQLHLPSP